MKKILVLSLICCLTAFGFSACTTPQRSTASAPSDDAHNEEMDAVLNIIFKSANPGKEAIQQYDKLFVLLLKANQFIAEFEKDLDTKLAFKRKNPGSSIEEPLHSDSYRQLLKVWNLKKRYSHQIEYLYSRCLEIRSDTNLSDNQRKVAALVIKDVTAYLETSRDLQRIELQPIMTSLNQIHSEFMTNYKKKLQLENKPIKDISAIAISPTFSHNIFPNLSAYKQYTAKIPHAQNDALLNSAEYKNLSNEVDRDLSEIPDLIFENRSPQSNQDLKCGGGKKICASTGEEGNIIGGVFPSGVWSLTYDDGPHNTYTSQIMELFIKHKDKHNPRGEVTFFWQAKNVAALPALTKKAVDNKFSIQNHSYDHTNLFTIKENPSALTKQIITSNNVIEAEVRKYIPHYKVRYFRCPYGSCYAPKIPQVRKMLADRGQLHAYWRIDSLDWKLQDAHKVSDLVIKQMELLGRGVILFHDVQQSTVETTRRLLAWIKDQNDNKGKKHKLVTLPEAVDITNGIK